MANAVIARFEYAEGGSVSITVQVESTWPDGLNEARVQAIRGLREAMEDEVVGTELDDDGEG